MSFIIITISFALAISSSWAYSYFGLSSFEQIVYHVKVPLEGTNTQFIFGWLKKCGLPSLIFGICLFWVPLFWAWIILGCCVMYGLHTIHLFDYIYNQFKSTKFYDEYFKEVHVTSPNKKMNLIHIYLESVENTYLSKEDGGQEENNYIKELGKLAKENINFSHSDKIGGSYTIDRKSVV